MISAYDLKPGERVEVNCELARVQKTRILVFHTIVNRAADLLPGIYQVLRMSLPDPPWAGFISRHGNVGVIAYFPITPDGQLVDEEKRRITIESRMVVMKG